MLRPYSYETGMIIECRGICSDYEKGIYNNYTHGDTNKGLILKTRYNYSSRTYSQQVFVIHKPSGRILYALGGMFSSHPLLQGQKLGIEYNESVRMPYR